MARGDGRISGDGRMDRRRVPALQRGIAVPSAGSSPLGRSLTAYERAALIAYAKRGIGQDAADDLGVELGAFQHCLERAYAKLGVRSAIDAFRSLGWLRVPNDGPPIPLVVRARTTESGT
jgi:hypothetical protein